MSYSITLDHVPIATNPNARWHPMKKARLVKAERTTAEMLWREQLGSMTGPKYKAFTVTITWRAKSEPHLPDLDNAKARMKATIDGAKDAGIIFDDKGWREGGPYEPIVTKGKPSVTITITPAEART